MRMNNTAKIVMVLSFAAALSAVCADTAFGQKKPFAAKGFFISANAPSVAVKGDFDGTMILSDGEELFFVPTLGGSLGFGFGAGWKGAGTMIEFGYQQSGQTGTFEGTAFEGMYHRVGITGKRHFVLTSPIQPYVMMGVNYPWLTIDNSSVSDTLAVGNATYSGIGFDFGAGLTFYVTPRIFFSGGLDFRLIGYQYVSGVSGETKNIKNLILNDFKRKYMAFIGAGGLGFSVGVGITL